MYQNKITTLISVFLILAVRANFSHAVLLEQLPDQNIEFMFIENQAENNYFVAPVNYTMKPSLIGANKWTSSGTRQKSLAYVDSNSDMRLDSSYSLDMWEEGPITYPYTTQQCLITANNCNPSTGTSVFSPPLLVDKYGFYGVTPATGYNHAAISDSFFTYLNSMNVGDTLTRTMSYCATTAIYDPKKGERCIDQSTGSGSRRTVHHTKMSHLTVKRTGAVTNLMVDSAGNPVILPGSQGCELDTKFGIPGVVCEFLDYEFNSQGGGYAWIRLDTALMEGLTLDSEYHLQKSVDKSIWRTHGNGLNITTLSGNNKIYLFMSTELLKQIVNLNSGELDVKKLINLLFTHSVDIDTGYYELSGTTGIHVQPREFSVSITSSDNITNPYQGGKVGEDILKFNYDIIKSASMSSSSFDITISQDIPGTWDNGYCLFHPEESTYINRAVPVPAYISFKKEDGSTFRQLIDCDHGKISLQDNNIIESYSPIVDPSPSGSTTRFYNLDLEFDLTDESTLRTVNNAYWEGEVHQSGTLTVKAIWH